MQRKTCSQVGKGAVSWRRLLKAHRMANAAACLAGHVATAGKLDKLKSKLFAWS